MCSCIYRLLIFSRLKKRVHPEVNSFKKHSARPGTAHSQRILSAFSACLEDNYSLFGKMFDR